MMLNALAIFGLVTAALIQSYHYYLFKGLPFQQQSEAEQYFSEDYYAARANFREAISKHPSPIELHTLKLDIGLEGEGTDVTENLSIDIGFLRRSKNKVIIHISGTHGVEGFAGSAVQLSLLQNPSATTTSDNLVLDDDESKPTIVFVHALNAYGFAKLRRFNENNVDLNRNFLTESEFKKLIARDPNHSGYVDCMDLINPTESFAKKWDTFYLEAAKAIAQHGFLNLKSALVSGNYRFEKTIFYGGQNMEQSHVLLKDFLLKHLEVDKIEKLGIIDVHTGLGKSGMDSLGSIDPENANEMEQIFGGEQGEFTDRITSMAGGTQADDALSGYGNAGGFLIDGLVAQIFPSVAKRYVMIQEFGTVPGVVVTKAMRAENTMYHYDNENRHPVFSEALRDVFYLKNNPGWKTSIVSRGSVVFHQLHSHMC